MTRVFEKSYKAITLPELLRDLQDMGVPWESVAFVQGPTLEWPGSPPEREKYGRKGPAPRQLPLFRDAPKAAAKDSKAPAKADKSGRKVKVYLSGKKAPHNAIGVLNAEQPGKDWEPQE